MEPGPIRGPFVEWLTFRKTNRTIKQKPSQSFVEGTNFVEAVFADTLSVHTLHFAFIRTFMWQAQQKPQQSLNLLFGQTGGFHTI